ncbi:Predicted arabinose efflux permease, MFS family [Clostridium acidisoli DSM 12555]|uniref:Predicted arabinose efflux permease, MFS family n=2 Tax=Clostridium TaxID=1485 RepID=A0A1W1XE40_9CLOT|nr:MFS transporter [Clostridium acidisoli]SMC21771.1 Predicted arabinose efflux permease, MFS family [Clostridium acidisoli DSM 12555]
MMNKENINKKTFILSKSIILLMAITCGVTVANLYYSQPLLSQIANTFHVSQASAGIVSTLTQIGYAFGLFFFVPLGDVKERRSLIIKMLCFIAIALLIVAVAPSYPILLIASFLVGFTTIVPQIIVPFAAHLAKPKERGKIIGIVMSGVLIGILLSRTFSGLIGGKFGWRIVYFCAASFMILFAVLIKKLLPTSIPSSNISYKNLLSSIVPLFKSEPVLREASINGAAMFASFSAFWTALVFLLGTSTYKMGSREAGLFGLVGVAGALIAPFVGKISDKKTPRFTIGIAITLSTLSYICFWFLGYKLLGLIIGIILLDIGSQTGLVSNQARIQALNDESRSRINTVFMVFYFMGGAVGSFLGALGWQYYGWHGVCLVGILFQLIAMIFHFIIYRKNN